MQRIQFGNAVFEGANNVYLLPDSPTTLIDAGIATDEGRAALRDGLASAGRDVADVERVVVTHWHHDHSGLAGEIQRESGATVYAHAADAPLIAGEESAVAAEQAELRDRLDLWGVPEEPRTELLDFLDSGAVLRGDPADVTPIRDGDEFAAGDLTLRTVHLPGHAAGLCAFEFEIEADSERAVGDVGGDALGGERTGREAFVGDAVLPKYTPNVGGADVRVESPLVTYADSLVRAIERDYDRAWPGHRDPIASPSRRAAAILAHHRERTRKVVSVLRERGPCDAWTVSAALFGDLGNIHILHGPGEAYAHLDHLAARGVAERDGGEYRLVESDPDVDALFPSVGIDADPAE